MSITKVELRADVRSALDSLLAESLSLEDFESYERAKSMLSHICGWDAPAELYDQYQYDVAIAAYIRAAGI